MSAETAGRAAYEAFRSAVPDWVCNVPAGPWDELSPAIRAGFDAIAAQEPNAAEVGMRVRTAPCTVEAHDHEHFQVRTNRHWLCGHLLASVLAVQGIVAAARPQPAPELAEIDPDKLDLISAWFDLDDARRGRTGPPEVQADLRRWATLVRGIRERAGLPS